MGWIVAEQIDENAGEGIPEHESRCHCARRAVGPADPEEVRDEQQVLRAVIEHDRMSKSFGVRKPDAPPDIRETADDLSVDEVTDASHSHQECTRDDQCVGELQKRFLVRVRERPRADARSEQQSMRSHSAKPVRGHHPWVLMIEGPLVESDLDRAPSRQDRDREHQAERVDLAASQPQSIAPLL